MNIARRRLLSAWLWPLLLIACDAPGGDGTPYYFAPDGGDAGAGGQDAAASVDATVPDAAGPVDTAQGAADTARPPEDTAQPPGPAPVLDPGCLDGQYDEALPDDSADISAAIAAYTPGAFRAFIDQVLDARYPTGSYLVAHAVSEYTQQDCVALFTQGATGSADALLDRMETVVHECGHMLDFARGTFSANGYVIRPDLVLTCEDGDARARGGRTIPRSSITQDEYDSMLPDDFYKDTYLVGDGSEQGFNMLMEEAVQYVNSLATRYALRDQMGQFMSTSARDGILTFLWYIERYLRLARTTDPEAHAFILGDACWRELILTVWGRGWQYLDETAGMAQLGIDDDQIEALVLRPELLDEIDRVRQAHGCD